MYLLCERENIFLSALIGLHLGVRKLITPLLFLIIVIFCGSAFLCYSIRTTAKAKAQTGGGIMGTYRMKYLAKNNETYVVVDTQFSGGKSTVVFSDSTFYSWGIKDYTFIWHYNTKEKKWEDALKNKSDK